MNNEATTVVDNLIYSPVMNEDGDTVPSFHLQLQYGLAVEEFEQYINRLGNLTLLENSINKSIHNSAYDAKRLAYQHSKFYLTKSIPMLSAVGSNTAMTRTNEKLQDWAEWNKTSIDERQQMLYNISEEIWGISSTGV